MAHAWLAVMLGALVTHAQGAAPAAAATAADYVEGEALVIFKPDITTANARQASSRHRANFVRKYEWLSRQRQRVHCHVRSDTQSTAALIAELQGDPGVESAEPNYRRYFTSMAAPNDLDFTKLWALRNTGQTVNGLVGTAGADIRFLDAWDLAKPATTQIIIAVLDTGMDLAHPDLAANLWRNPGEIAGDGLDNDGNGLVDDCHGYDFADADADPTDADLHGSHVAGIIAGVSNNGQGITGTSYQARLMPLKISSDGLSIDTAAEIAAIDYAVMMKARGVNVVAINASFGGAYSTTAESNAIQAAANAGIVFCAAAGNESSDNTTTPTYPANYRLPNMIVVAASDSTDHLAAFSNYGTKVDLAAPGTDIFSTIPTWKGTITSALKRGTTNYATTTLTHGGFTAGISGTVYSCGLGYVADFPAAVAGNIALIQRGTLTFAAKVSNAMHAGATAVVIYNNTTGSINGTLATSIPYSTAATWLPALTISQADGLALLAALPATATLSNTVAPATIYTYEDGTSMATPYVTAAVAFAAQNFPAESATQRVARVVNQGSALSALTGKVISGKRLNLARIVDTDANGLPDWWETAYFAAIGVSPAADADGDGFPNLEEFQIGSPPNMTTALAIYKTEIVPNGTNKDFRISFPTAAGVTYRVERNDSLAAGSWLQLGSNVSGTGTPASATDGGAVTLHPRRFYRVRRVAP